MLSVIGHFVPRQKMSLHPRTKGTWALLDNKPTLLIMRSFLSKNKASSRKLKGRKHANTQKIHKKKKKKKTYQAAVALSDLPPVKHLPPSPQTPAHPQSTPKEEEWLLGGVTGQTYI